MEGGTCHNDKPGHVREEIEEKGRVMERKKWGDVSKAGPAIMTSRAKEQAMGEGGVWGGVISCLSLWLVGHRWQVER